MITRELLEHYLRATGWEPGATGWWFLRAWTLTLDSAPELALEYIGGRIDQADRVAGKPTLYRLGLCAAAEYLLREHRTQERLLRQCGSLSLLEKRDDYAAEVLKMAGIDPARWEEARR